MQGERHWKHSPSQVLVEGKTLQVQSCPSNSLAVPEPGAEGAAALGPCSAQPLPGFRAPALALTLRSAITQRWISTNCKDWAFHRGYLGWKTWLTYSSKNSVSHRVDLLPCPPWERSWINLWQLWWVSKEPWTPNAQSSSSPDGFSKLNCTKDWNL